MTTYFKEKKLDDVFRIYFKNNSSELENTIDKNVLRDLKYIKKANILMSELLDRGSIMQCPDGSVIATETKVITVVHKWDSKKGKFYRIKTGVGTRFNNKNIKTQHDKEHNLQKEKEFI